MYILNSNFTTSVSRAKLINISCRFINYIATKKIIPTYNCKRAKLHNNSKSLIVQSAQISILSKCNNFYFPNSLSINVDIGSHFHEYNGIISWWILLKLDAVHIGDIVI
jgi:hypothetical protein